MWLNRNNSLKMDNYFHRLLEHRDMKIRAKQMQDHDYSIRHLQLNKVYLSLAGPLSSRPGILETLH